MRRIEQWMALALLAGCVTGIQLTGAGEGVRRIEESDKPPGCRLIGDVVVGIPPDAAHAPTQEDLFVLMRNQAGQHGGNVLIVDNFEERNPSDEEARHWVGRGRSYGCPDAETATSGGEADETGLEDESTGLEDETGLEPDEEEEAPDDSGVSDEDLLDL